MRAVIIIKCEKCGNKYDKYECEGICDMCDEEYNPKQLENKQKMSKEKFRNIMCEYIPTIFEDSGQPEWTQGELDKAYEDLIGNGVFSRLEEKVSLQVATIKTPTVNEIFNIMMDVAKTEDGEYKDFLVKREFKEVAKKIYNLIRKTNGK